MKSVLFLVLTLFGLAACSAPATPTQPVVATFPPLPLAQTTHAPTPTGQVATAATPPAATAPAPSATTQATAVPTRAAPTSTPTVAPTLSAPAVLARFKLLDLAGEGRAPSALALLGPTLYTANRDSNNLGIVSGDRATGFLPVPDGPSTLVADVAHNRLYVGTFQTPTLAIFEDGRLTRSVAAGGRVNALALDGNDLYVALDSEALIERYDAATLTKRDELKLSQGFGVSDVAVDRPHGRLYASTYGKIIALDLSNGRELNTLDVPYLYDRFAVHPTDGSVWAGAYDEKARRAYVVGFAADGRELARLNVGSDLKAAAFDDKGRLYVLDTFNNIVHVVQTPGAQLVASIPVNEAPAAAVFDPARGAVVVASRDNDTLSVLDTQTLLVSHNIPLAGQLTALVANPAQNRVYVASGSTNSVFVLEGERVVRVVKTGNYPAALALDTAGSRLYAANRADGTLTVINTGSLEIQATAFITRWISTVAVDPQNHRLFAGSSALDPATLKPLATFYAKGLTLDSQTAVVQELVNPALRKLYGLASNGVPGSNSRLTLYRFNYDDLSQSRMLGSKNGGNTSALALDPTTNLLYAANTHPLAYTHGLDVFDSGDKLVQSLALPSHTTALAVNPETHHLFLAHARTYQPYPLSPAPRDNTVEILDTRTLGAVSTLEVPGDPWRMVVAGYRVYVAGYGDASITILGDAPAQQPPAPTPTLTPTPYPTFAPPSATPSGSAGPTRTPDTARACATEPPEPFLAPWQAARAQLGCLLGAPTEAEFAVQTFSGGGYMFDDLRDKAAQKIYALLPDQTFSVFDDTWKEGDTERPCPDAPLLPGRFRPKRGFGKVWCANPKLMAQLPGAVAEEHAVTLQIARFDRGMLWSNTPQGIITLLDVGTWR